MSNSKAKIICGVIFLAAAALRFLGLFNDLWLDEIWSLALSTTATSPLDIFTKIHQDNNHYLNTLFLYLLGDWGNWPGYRYLSWICGVASVGLAGLIGFRQNLVAGFLSLILTGFSYVLILYSSEARGYAPAIFFALLSYYLLESFIKSNNRKTAIIASICVVLGLASHLVFLIFYASATLWILYSQLSAGNKIKESLLNTAYFHAAPLLFCLFIYFTDLIYLQFGGGSPGSIVHAFAESITWTLGVSELEYWAVPTYLFGALALTYGIILLGRESRAEALFFSGIIALIPLTFATLGDEGYVYVRYFILGITFSLLLLSRLLARLYQSGPYGRIATLLIVSLYIVSNSFYTAQLIKNGRGGYSLALNFMVENSDTNKISIGGDHEFRIPASLQFFVKTDAPKREIHYIAKKLWPAEGVDWIIFHKESSEAPTTHKMKMRDASGNIYKLEKIFPSAPLSGMHWFIYRKIGKKAQTNL